MISGAIPLKENPFPTPKLRSRARRLSAVTQRGYERSEPKWPLVNAGHAGSTKSMPAYWTAALKLPKRRRIVFSDGLMPAWVTASSAWSEARLPFKPNRRRCPPNSKVFELCMAGSTNFWSISPFGPNGRVLGLSSAIPAQVVAHRDHRHKECRAASIMCDIQWVID